MIQAYADDTGNDGKSPVFLFSALIGEAKEWDIFSNQWDACLRKSPSIRYLKMDEAVSTNGQFYGFSVGERDDKLHSLCRVLNNPNLTKFSFVLPFSEFQKKWGSSGVKPFSEPYFFPFHATIGAIGYEALGRGAKEPCEICFDEDVIFGPRAKAWYPMMRECMEDILRRVMPVEPLFRDDEVVLPLQAADLTAWMQRMSRMEGLGEFSWLTDELSQLKRSLLSKTLTLDMMTGTAPKPWTEAFAAQNKAVLERYRETFGQDWPPKKNRLWARNCNTPC